jgi:hypothetical protein
MSQHLSDLVNIVPSANCPVNTIFVVGTAPKREDYATEFLFRRAYWSSPWCGRITLAKTGKEPQ